MFEVLKEVDPEIYRAMRNEIGRQEYKLDLIASENFVSHAVLAAMANVMQNKYAEGYPGARYYGGCQYVDIAENLAVERACRLFGAEFANVQPHSGSQANMAVYLAMLKPGDTVLGMKISHGGHLTHGTPISFSGKLYNAVNYGVNPETCVIDFDEVSKLAEEHKPQLIIVGASSYPRNIDFKPFREIADSVGAILLADIAHTAGLVAVGLHPDPVPYCDLVTTTLHKTLRGPRGGLIMGRKKYEKKIASAVFPGIQGGPMMHTIASKAVALKEALNPEFKEYQQQIVDNCQAMVQELLNRGYDLVTGGSDNHLLMIDLTNKGMTGKEAEDALDRAGIIVNKNAIPYDERPPAITSGVRIGTPTVTTRGMKQEQMVQIVDMIDRVLCAPENEQVRRQVSSASRELCEEFPLYQTLMLDWVVCEPEPVE
jgi:glycine hydroxymethyltransferase